MKQWMHMSRSKGKLSIPLLQTIVAIVLLVTSFFTVPQLTLAAAQSKDIAMGSTPYYVAINPIANKIYVVNYEFVDGLNISSVTIIDGASNKTKKVEVGESPGYIAVNPVTNKIYVLDSSNNSVTVIDGVSNETTKVPVGEHPITIAINPVSNKIYVVNSGVHNSELNKYVEGTGSITVIDGASNKTTTIAAATGVGAPSHIAVNPVTNKIYVTNGGRVNVDGSFDDEGSVSVIDGASNKTKATVKVGAGPRALAVNQATNKIYVANMLSDNVSVMDGATNKVIATVKAGSSPEDVAVNPVTNKIYVINNYGNNVTVIDGVNHKTTTVKAGHRPVDVAVNPVTNKIFVVSRGDYKDNLGKVNITVIDGSTNKTSTVATGKYPDEVAINPITNKIYVINSQSKNVTAINDAGRTANPLKLAITSKAGKEGADTTFSFRITNTYSQNAPLVQGVYYQIDRTDGPWKSAKKSGKDWTATVGSLKGGKHTIYVWALDAQENGIPSGEIAGYSFSTPATK
ncbi:YncE family protein [Paenibacillus sp. CAU 1782]